MELGPLAAASMVHLSMVQTEEMELWQVAATLLVGRHLDLSMMRPMAIWSIQQVSLFSVLCVMFANTQTARACNIFELCLVLNVCKAEPQDCA